MAEGLVGIAQHDRARMCEADRFAWLALLSAAAVLTALRLGVLFVSELSLHGDEAQYWTWSLTPDFGYYSKPPLIAWTIAGATALCGDDAWCVRAPATLYHLCTAIVLALLARDIAGRRSMAWTGIVWLTLPSVTLSSVIMSTDAPLLFFWSAALLAYRRLLLRPGVGASIALAFALGLGLNAKYAMAYFLPCMLAHLAVDPVARRQAQAAVVPLALALIAGITLLLPNSLWNASHGWVTLGHTADNAHWQGLQLHPGNMFKFLFEQFGVFGPVLFACLLGALPFTRRRFVSMDAASRFLLAFCLPVLIVITLQALFSRAHANWAATAYPAATVLVTALLLRSPARRAWLRGTLALHIIVMLIVYGGISAPDRLSGLISKDPFADMRGWQETADEVSRLASTNGISTILMDDRMTMASLAYALRDRPVAIRAWNRDSRINNHYELSWRYDPASDGMRVLLITPYGLGDAADHFESARRLPDITRHGRSGQDLPLTAAVLEGPK
jgi:4-amino-4-deoxy-L-arabinose transferase-like glycosyltransferase